MSKSIRFIKQQWTLNHIITCLSKTTWWPHIIMQELLLPRQQLPDKMILTYPMSFPPFDRGLITSRCSGKWARTPREGPFWDLQVYERVEDFIPNSIKVALVIGHWQLGIGRWAPGIGHQLYERVEQVCHQFRSVKRPQRANRCILWLWKSRENVLVLWFIHIYKTLHLQQLKVMQSCKLGRRKGYPCQQNGIRRYLHWEHRHAAIWRIFV